MNTNDDFKKIISFFASSVLTSMLSLAFAVIWYGFYSDTIILPFYRKGNWLVIGIYITIMVLFMKVYNGYSISFLRRRESLISQIIAMLGVNTLTYLQVSLIGRHFMNVYPFLVLSSADFLIISLWTLIFTNLYRKLCPPCKLIVIYGSKRDAVPLINKMSRYYDKYIISEAISAGSDIAEIHKKILLYDGVIFCDLPERLRSNLLKYCFMHDIRVYLVPEIPDIIVRGACEIHLFDAPLLICRSRGLSAEQNFFKRAFDVIFSLIMLIITLPVMLITALAIKAEDGGTIFYKQKRVTSQGREFYVYKFRSMSEDAEKDGIPLLASENDSRITETGAFIRRYRIDELPQFLNVLKGEMSVVGPRPERPELISIYEKDMPEFSFRLSVKAGITGYAQVFGRYDTSPYDKLKMDLMYIEKYSVMLDIKIILMTIKIMLSPNSDT